MPGDHSSNHQEKGSRAIQRMPTHEDSGDTQRVVNVDAATINAAVANIKSAFNEIVNSLSQKPPSSNQKAYRFVFVVDDDLLRKLNSRVEEIMAKLTPFPDSTLRFYVDAQLPDASRKSFDNLDIFLNRAGDTYDPTSVTMLWEQRLASPLGAIAAVSISFEIEPLFKLELSYFTEENAPEISINVSGQSDSWVTATISRIEPVILSAKVGGIYKPLMIFNDKYINALLLVILFYVSNKLSLIKIDFSDIDLDHSKCVAKKLAEMTVAEKTISSSLVEIVKRCAVEDTDIAGKVIWYFVGFIILSISGYPFRLLTPRSYIAVGLGNARYREYDSIFRFVVFTIVFGIVLAAFIVPYIRLWFGI